MIIEPWINRMIENASKFINEAKEICGKIIVQAQEMSKELEINKEQKSSWQGVGDELQEMSKVDVNTLILEKVISNLNDKKVHIWSKSTNWKVINISKGISEFEKLIVVCEQTKVKF